MSEPAAGSSQAGPRGLAALSSFAVLASLALLLAAGCGGLRALPPAKAADPALVVAHSAGIVASASPLKVVFTSDRGRAGEAGPAGAFRLYPAVKGEARWQDSRSLVFVPVPALARGQRYRVDVDLGLLDGQAAGGSEYFSFSVMATEQKAEVETLPPRIAKDGAVEVQGTVSLADGASDKAAEGMLSASEGKISWRHEGERIHRFTVAGLKLGQRERKLTISWNARSVGGNGKGSTGLRLPAEASFELLASRAIDDYSGESGRSSGIELAFSRSLDRSQDLRGIVSVEGVDDLRMNVSGSLVSLYSEKWPASAKIKVAPGLRDSLGRRLAVPVAAEVAVTWEKPLVRFLTKGTILPTSQGLVLPIETMNLAGLVVEALQVYGDNMMQFLQVNDLGESKEMKRVGAVVWSKRIDLGWKDDRKNTWVRQGLDLGPLLAAHKDGMFQIRITFRPVDIRYTGPEGADYGKLRFPDDRVVDPDEGEQSFWSYAEQWANGYDDFNAHKTDPNHPAYYLPTYDHDITIRRNVVVSDIGAAVKRESDGTWHVAASDLRTAKPLSGALVTLYSLQRRSLASGSTGPLGLVVLKTSGQGDGEPAFASVQAGGQTSWLKVDQGSSLAVGHFDVSGEESGTGLKGFLYGERGVWRPGDDMHLVFVLQDRTGKLPSKYPVKFELEDPLGRVVRSSTYTDSVNGFYAIEAGTTPDAPTGTYRATVTAGGKSFGKTLKVESIMPNRLKLALDWGKAAYLSGDTTKLSLAASWLTGAPGGPFKADASAVFRDSGEGFSTLSDYSFSDPTREVGGERLVLFDGRLGNDGSAVFDVELAPQGLAPGKLKADILTRVFEPSGLFSSETTTVDFHPYERYVGMRLPKGDQARGMLLTDKDQRVDLALVDRDGKLVKGGGEVEVALYQLEWRWWWEKGEDSLAQRADDIYSRPLKKERVKIGSDGRGSWTFQVKYPAWGRFLVRVEDKGGGSIGSTDQGHASGQVVYIDWPGWAGKSRDSGGAQAMLELTVGKAKYAPGDTASFTFPSNENGGALVAIERGGKILKEEWIKTSKDTTVYQFPVTPAMAPNVYAHVTFVQPHLQTANDLPIRLYGVVPVMVEDAQTRLLPVIEAPATMAPGKEASFTVREDSGRPMTYTVAVVDEGLLGITRFKTQDPWDEFYKKEASALTSWDLYNNVAGAYAGSLETLLAIGGSDEGLGGAERKPSRFPPVVWFFAPRELKAGEIRRESFTMGPYIGAVRIMVVAGSGPVAAARPAGGISGISAFSGSSSSSGSAFGAAEASVPVKADLMAQLTAPRVLSPGEKASIPATVFAFLGKKRVAVELSAEGALSLTGDARKSIDFDKDGDLSTSFAVSAGSAPGRGRLVLKASAEGKTAESAVDLEVRAVGLPVYAVSPLSLDAGKTWTGPLQLPGEAGTNSVVIELSKLRSIGLSQRVDWLLQYPHGCAEQTTSAAFPQIYLAAAASLDEASAAKAKSNVAAAIERLRGFQTPRGGFAFWPGQGEEDEWITAYVSHFLLSARREGYAVPSGMLDAGLDYMERNAKVWNSSEAWSQAIQAYRLYDLAMAGRAAIGAMNRFRDFPTLPTSVRFRLAASYSGAGMREAAASLLSSRSTEVEDYEGLEEHTYGTAVRERAVVLDALLAMGDTDRALPVYNRLAADLDSSRWYSTQDLGPALAAALPYIVLAAKADSPEIRASVSVPGQAPWTKTLRLTKALARLDAVADKAAPAGSPGANAGASATVTLENRGSTPVFVRLIARGTPAAGTEKAVSKGLSLGIRYLSMDGKVVDPNALSSGSDFLIEATVRNRSGQDLANMALSQLIPSGWEIVDFRPAKELAKPKSKSEDEEATARPSKAPEPSFMYRDIRDDRVYSYFDLDAKETRTIKTYVNKTYEGSFWLPAASVQAMYDERWQALVPGRWLAAPAGAGEARDLGVPQPSSP